LTDVAIYEDLQKTLKSPVYLAEPMSKHTSWRIGGPADLFVAPGDEEDLRQALIFARDHGLPVTLVGNGSNLLVSDYGIRGMVIKIGPGLSGIETQGNIISAGAGTPLPRLANYAMRSGLAGFEFLAGIPGTVGGALVMNAGANGYTIGERVRQVTAYDYAGDRLTFNAGELVFKYRKSSLADQKVIVTGVLLEGVPGRVEEIKKRMENYLARRRKTQPLEFPNAGSVFKNPPGDSAGRLIEAAGCKAMRVGNIQVSPRHANFFVNLGGGVARDVLDLIERVQHLVEEKCGVKLALEVQMLGEF
jgi:UDP-N-acetylmuramate dehydrogenase